MKAPEWGVHIKSSFEKQFEDSELRRAFAAPVSPGSWHLSDRQKGGCETVPNSANSHCTRGCWPCRAKDVEKFLCLFIYEDPTVSA